MRIPHSKPSIDEREINAIKKVLESGWIVQGEKVKLFENEICNYIGVKKGSAVAVSSGTAALYVALKLLGVQAPTDEVIVPNYVCTAVLNAIFLNNATPVIVDIDMVDFNMTYQEIKKKINNKSKAIIVPHTFGVPADIPSMKELGIPIIEDCAQALGSKIYNKHVGLFGEISIFSFYATKLITTGQGGMLISNNSDYIERAREYQAYDMRKIYHPRFNFQMTDIQAAMGIVQLKKFNKFLINRKTIAEQYIKICEQKDWNFQKTMNSNFTQNWYRFVIKSDHDLIGKIKKSLNDSGVSCVVPIEKWQLLSTYLKLNSEDFKNSEKITETTLSLPIFPDLADHENFEEILEILRKC